MFPMMDPELEEPEVEECGVCEHAADSHDRRGDDGDCCECPQDSLRCCGECGFRHAAWLDHDSACRMKEADLELLSYAL